MFRQKMFFHSWNQIKRDTKMLNFMWCGLKKNKNYERSFHPNLFTRRCLKLAQIWFSVAVKKQQKEPEHKSIIVFALRLNNLSTPESSLNQRSNFIFPTTLWTYLRASITLTHPGSDFSAHLLQLCCRQ